MRNYIMMLPDEPRLSTQRAKNDYYYECMEEINRAFVRNNHSFEWKVQMERKILQATGVPRKLTFWQRIFS